MSEIVWFWRGDAALAAVGCSSVPCPPRMAGFDGSAWDEEEEEPAPDHQYYNDFPGKEPPIGGVVDMRLRDGAAQTPNHLGATLVRLWARPRVEAPCYKGDAGIPTRPWALRSGLFHHENRGTCLPGTSSSPERGEREGVGSAAGFTTHLSPQPVGQSSGGEYDPRKQHAPAQGNVTNVAGPSLLSWTPSAPTAGTGVGTEAGWSPADHGALGSREREIPGSGGRVRPHGPVR